MTRLVWLRRPTAGSVSGIVREYLSPIELLGAVTGKMKLVIADRFPLLEAARAHEFIERSGYAGKAVSTIV